MRNPDPLVCQKVGLDRPEMLRDVSAVLALIVLWLHVVLLPQMTSQVVASVSAEGADHRLVPL
jgi:hypothetical protein